MYDQHVHTNYSPDSNTTMEDYITSSTQPFYTFTDHYDLSDPWNHFEDVTFDFQKQRQEMNQLEQKYNVKILQGIEVGYSAKSKAKIRNTLQKNTFDIVLLSVHHNDQIDYMMKNKDATSLEVIEDYFKKLLEALTERFDADVLCHIDFGLRARECTLKDIKTFEPLLKDILNEVIIQNMSLEINAKGLIRYNTKELIKYIVKIYQDLGGKDYVLNSDAHTVEYYEISFAQIKEFLKSVGITHLNYYKKRQKYSFPI